MTTTDALDVEPLGRTSRQLLLDRVYGPFWVGNLLSNSGTWFQNIAAILLIHELTGSATYVGLVSALQFGMTLLLSPFAGTWADRFDRRQLMIAGQSLGFISAMTLAVLGADGLTPALILFLIGLAGCGHAMSSPAMQASIPSLVREPEVAQAVALQSLTFNLARAIGPAAGALVYAQFGPSVSFLVNAASYAVFIAVLAVLQFAPRVPSMSNDRSLLGGLRHVRARPALMAVLFGIGALGFVMDPVNTLTPSLAAELGRGDTAVGVMVTTFGAGAVAVVPLVPWLRRRLPPGRVGILALTTLAVSQVALGFSPTLLAALVALFIGGMAFLSGVADFTAAVHASVEDDLKGRVMALWGMAFLGSRPLAALLHGSLADAVGPSLTTVVTASFGLSAALFVSRRLDGDARRRVLR